MLTLIASDLINHSNDLTAGKISMAIETGWFEPRDDSDGHKTAAETKLQFTVSMQFL